MKYLLFALAFVSCKSVNNSTQVQVVKVDSVAILFEPWQQQIIESSQARRDSLRIVNELSYKCDSFHLLHALTTPWNLKNPRSLDSVLNDRYRDSVNHYLALLWKHRKYEQQLDASVGFASDTLYVYDPDTDTLLAKVKANKENLDSLLRCGKIIKITSLKPKQ